MDNQFDNNIYGFEPQKPLTEKPGAPQPEDIPNQSVGAPQPPVQPVDPAEDKDFDPIRHTAVYSDNSFKPAQPQPPVRQQPPEQPPQPPVQPQYYAPQQYRPTQYIQPQYPQPQQYPPAQPYPQPPIPPAEETPKPVSSKPNTALIVVIVVLCVLLAASTFGIVGYSLYNSNNSGKTPTHSITIDDRGNKDDRSDDDNGSDIFGNGGGFSFDVPEETEPIVHDESDFSDKTDKNYAGMKLNDKPADAGDNSKYNAGYAFSTEADSVVSVLCYTDKTTDNNNNVASQGSGIVLSSDGYIITNSHVVGNSKTAYAIKVVTADNKEYKAGVVGYDARTDIALLKLVDASGLKAATFGDSDKITQGEDIIIIGNPGGIEYKNSMTKGVVSAIDRDASTKSIVKYIQTDAAINPGNSGGPAVNMFGQVIGVASAKIVDEKYEGMGFCIPSAKVKEIVDKLMKDGYVSGRVKIGISGVALSSVEAEYYGVPRGIKVQSINEDGPCDDTELQEGDIITALDGKEIKTFSDIYLILEDYKDGDKAKLKFYRQTTGKDQEIEITLQADK